MTTIRELRAEDRAAWEPLWAGYLDFYRGEVGPEVTDRTFALMTERREGCFGLAAEADDGAVVGIAHLIIHLTTWSLGPTCYLEDLFVYRGHRGPDVGPALIEDAAAPPGRRAPGRCTGIPGVQRPGALALRDGREPHLVVHYERALG